MIPVEEAAHHSKYDFTPLQSSRDFRVLELEPAQQENEPLRCRLQNASIDDEHKPSYEALSYVWGSPDKTHGIRSGKAIIPCTVNCHAALRALRHKSKHRLLWVDAICINQDSALEKSAQVRLMGEIYASCTRVVIWLGTTNGKSEIALKNVLSTVKRSIWWHIPDWRRYFFRWLFPGYMQWRYGTNHPSSVIPV